MQRQWMRRPRLRDMAAAYLGVKGREPSRQVEGQDAGSKSFSEMSEAEIDANMEQLMALFGMDPSRPGNAAVKAGG